MIEWLLVIFLNGNADYDVWGGYTQLEACQRTAAVLELKYQRKKEPVRAECWPVTATLRDSRPGQFYQKP